MGAYSLERRVLAVCLGLLLAMSLTGSGAFADEVVLGHLPSITGAEELDMVSQQLSDGRVVDVLTGSEVEIPSLEAAPTTHGGLLGWEKTSDWTDGLGFRHEEWAQVYTLPTPSGRALPEVVRNRGVHLSGAKLSFHFNAEGTLYCVKGTRFQDVLDIGGLTIADIHRAQSKAWEVLQQAGYSVANMARLEPDFL